jgi:hypothetical protein
MYLCSSPARHKEHRTRSLVNLRKTIHTSHKSHATATGSNGFETFESSSCNYRRSDRTYESWAVRPFKLDASGQQNLRENYEKYTGRRKHNTTKETQQSGKDEDNSGRADETENEDIDENELNALHQKAKDNLKRFKFGLSAHNEPGPSTAELKLNGPADPKYHEAKKEELKSHQEKGTWTVVPLPKGVKPKLLHDG